MPRFRVSEEFQANISYELWSGDDWEDFMRAYPLEEFPLEQETDGQGKPLVSYVFYKHKSRVRGKDRWIVVSDPRKSCAVKPVLQATSTTGV